MKKEQVINFFKGVKDSVERHSPEILTGIGIASMVTSTVLAVKATPKATLLLNEKKEKFETDKMPVDEVIKTTWKCYIPATISGATGIACLIGASSVNAKRNAALATAYKLSETVLAEYKSKVIETIGEKKELKIREEINEDRIKNNPVSRNEIIVTEKGNTLCYDVISARYFKSDIETIRRIVNKLNSRMLYENYISLSEFYDELDLSHTKNSDEIGWSLNRDGLIEISFGSHIADNGEPCIVVDYNVAPRYDFSKLM